MALFGAEVVPGLGRDACVRRDRSRIDAHAVNVVS